MEEIIKRLDRIEREIKELNRLAVNNSSNNAANFQMLQDKIKGWLTEIVQNMPK